MKLKELNLKIKPIMTIFAPFKDDAKRKADNIFGMRSNIALVHHKIRRKAMVVPGNDINPDPAREVVRTSRWRIDVYEIPDHVLTDYKLIQYTRHFRLVPKAQK